ncbi:MAG: hypothetical protein AAF334_07640 [Pseudomonadota bacterium]
MFPFTIGPFLEAMMLAAMTEYLNGYVDKDIKDICDTGFDAANHNHCAHFVSHAMDIKTGLVCGSMAYATRGQGTSIRVNEIYNSCSERGLWSAKPHGKKMGLAYVTLPGNVDRSGDMGSNPKKHIGVFVNDTIWHYSNGQDKVVTHSPTDWHTRFRGVYGSSTQMYYSNFPGD